jgi:signal transduction histidine kinase
VASAPAEPTATPLSGSRAGDAALALVVLLFSTIDVLTAVNPAVPGPAGMLDGRAALLVGCVTVTCQAALVLVRRRRPRSAFAALAVIGTVQFVAVGGFPTYTWGVLAFSVARAPGRALPHLAVPALIAPVAGAVLLPPSPGDWPELAGSAIGNLAVITVFVVAGVIPGRYSRDMVDRVRREQAAEDLARRSAALATERARIAEEIGSGVLAGLTRLVHRCEKAPRASTDVDLRGLREEARSVLAAMRRALGVLRSEPSTQDLAVRPPATPARWAVPLPDRPGVVTAVIVALSALLVAVLPVNPSDLPALDKLAEVLDLPWGSAPALLALAVQVTTIAWCRTAPLSALLVWGVSALVAMSLDATNLIVTAGWVVVAWGAASRAPSVRSAVVIGLTAPIANLPTIFPFYRAESTPWTTLDLLVTALSLAGMVPLWATGVVVRRHRGQGEQARRDQVEARDREVLAQERLRVARELHDTVAHHVSAIAVQSGAARMAPDPASRQAALAHIADSGRRVAESLPALAGMTPDPGGIVLDAAGLDRLLEPVRAAGLPVDVELKGEPAAVTGDAELFAQRILTEALTNVLRHAGPSPTKIVVEHSPQAVSVQVRDSGPVAAHHPSREGSGLGITGMRERAALLGGSVHLDAAEGTGWTVLADLPRKAALSLDD